MNWRECGTPRTCPFPGTGNNNINNSKRMTTKRPTNGKKAGASYEAVFIAEAMKRGLVILEPRGAFLPYDVMVENRHGVVLKVQIKGTTYMQAGKRNTYKVIAAKGKTRSGKTPVTTEDADVLAVYVAPVNSWYHIPTTHVSAVSINLRPAVPESKAQYEVWKDAWNVYEIKTTQQTT